MLNKIQGDNMNDGFQEKKEKMLTNQFKQEQLIIPIKKKEKKEIPLESTETETNPYQLNG